MKSIREFGIHLSVTRDFDRAASINWHGCYLLKWVIVRVRWLGNIDLAFSTMLLFFPFNNGAKAEALRLATLEVSCGRSPSRFGAMQATGDLTTAYEDHGRRKSGLRRIRPHMRRNSSVAPRLSSICSLAIAKESLCA